MIRLFIFVILLSSFVCAKDWYVSAGMHKYLETPEDTYFSLGLGRRINESFSLGLDVTFQRPPYYVLDVVKYPNVGFFTSTPASNVTLGFVVTYEF